MVFRQGTITQGNTSYQQIFSAGWRRNESFAHMGNVLIHLVKLTAAFFECRHFIRDDRHNLIYISSSFTRALANDIWPYILPCYVFTTVLAYPTNLQTQFPRQNRSGKSTPPSSGIYISCLLSFVTRFEHDTRRSNGLCKAIVFLPQSARPQCFLLLLSIAQSVLIQVLWWGAKTLELRFHVEFMLLYFKYKAATEYFNWL